MSRKAFAPKSEYESLADELRYALHELPVGVIGCEECSETLRCESLLQVLRRFEELSREHQMDNHEFIEACRWHFERYPHYLSRQRHFANYGNYIAKYGGPLAFAGPCTWPGSGGAQGPSEA